MTAMYMHLVIPDTPWLPHLRKKYFVLPSNWHMLSRELSGLSILHYRYIHIYIYIDIYIIYTTILHTVF